MKRSIYTTGDVISAVMASLVTGGLLGGIVGLGLAGLLWLSDTTVATWGTWAAIPAIFTGVAISIYMLWQFFAGNLLPQEMWGNLGKIFTRGGIG